MNPDAIKTAEIPRQTLAECAALWAATFEANRSDGARHGAQRDAVTPPLSGLETASAGNFPGGCDAE